MGILHGMQGALALLAAGDREFWLPSQRSTFAGEIDSLFMVIYWICVFFFLLILAMAVYFLMKYRRQGRNPTFQQWLKLHVHS